MENFASIFNDVIGPVMRGPSSSHCAAALRIGRLANDLMNGEISSILFEMDINGSLPTTHESQGSDMGLFGGILGWEADDPRLPESVNTCKKEGIKIEFKVDEYKDEHPNTYRITIENKTESHFIKAISTGGGVIEVLEIDSFQLGIRGDTYVLLAFCGQEHKEIQEYLKKKAKQKYILHQNEDSYLIELNSNETFDIGFINNLTSEFPEIILKELNPVLPVLAPKSDKMPFTNYREMLAYNKTKKLQHWELAIVYESVRGGISGSEVFDKMQNIVEIMQKSVQTGLDGTEYKDRILGNQSTLYHKKMEKNHLLPSGILNNMILYVTALMETKSSMGVIVAAPTAGSCAGLPGAVLGAANALYMNTEDITKAMLAAGLIGIFIAHRATFAAEVGGCQAECGSGSGMAAAALVTLAKGTLEQATTAASIALQNLLGMVCDPVANRVEVPCLGKNVLAASNALSCANMAMAGYDKVIPLDEVIETMDTVGKSIPHELRCTALGGLSITKTSRKIEERLKRF